MTHEQRMEGLVALLNRIDEARAWRQANPLPKHEPSFAYVWLTRRTANRPAVKVKAAA